MSGTGHSLNQNNLPRGGEKRVVYEDKFWVVSQIETVLRNSPDDNVRNLLPYFKWLLQVWNTNKDFSYPSLEEYNPDEEE